MEGLRGREVRSAIVLCSCSQDTASTCRNYNIRLRVPPAPIQGGGNAPKPERGAGRGGEKSHHVPLYDQH